MSFKKLSSPHTHTLGMPMILFPKLHGKIETKYTDYFAQCLFTRESVLCYVQGRGLSTAKNSHTFLSTTISHTFECASILRQTYIQAQNYAIGKLYNTTNIENNYV